MCHQGTQNQIRQGRDSYATSSLSQTTRMATKMPSMVSKGATDTNKCASLRLLEKKRELRDAQELLEAERASFTRKREELNHIESELNKKYNDLRQSKEKANQHMLQNNLKQERAEGRSAKEEHLCRELDSEMEVLQQQIDIRQ